MVVDNGSVYTKNLIDFISSQHTKFKQISHKEIPSIDISKFNSFILSGRRSNDKTMNAQNSKIIKHCISEKKPLLGICYGAEILALTLGGTIKKMSFLHKGPEIVTVEKKNALCNGKIDVFESHHYELSRLPSSLCRVGSSKNCTNEIVCLQNSQIFGTQFHPEMTRDGQFLIKNFCSLTES